MGTKEIAARKKGDLNGTRVLVVEDEYYIADDVRRLLDDAGAEVIGPYADFKQAEAAIGEISFDCAILDLNLQGQSAAPIADRLIKQGKSFAIATGYGSSAVPERLQQVPRIEKPFDPPALLQLVAQICCA